MKTETERQKQRACRLRRDRSTRVQNTDSGSETTYCVISDTQSTNQPKMSSNNQSVEARRKSDVVRDDGSGAGMEMETEMDHSGVGGGAAGSGTRTGLGDVSAAFGGSIGMEGDSWRDSTGSLSPNGGFGRDKEVTAGLSGFGRADGDSIMEGEGAWPCSKDKR